MHTNADRPSLWQEIADGHVKSPTLALLTVVLAVLLTGAVLVGSFLLTAIIPSWGRNGVNRTYVYVSDATLSWLAVLAALAFVGLTAWAWTRGRRRHHRFTYAIVSTLIVVVATTILSIASAALLRGDEELLVAGIIFVGIAAMLLVWVRIYRMSPQLPPWHDKTDGHLDLHCPACGYRMVGLKEARCPECGTSYTVDELLSRQTFAPLGRPLPPPPPAVAETH